MQQFNLFMISKIVSISLEDLIQNFVLESNSQILFQIKSHHTIGQNYFWAIVYMVHVDSKWNSCRLNIWPLK